MPTLPPRGPIFYPALSRASQGFSKSFSGSDQLAHCPSKTRAPWQESADRRRTGAKSGSDRDQEASGSRERDPQPQLSLSCGQVTSHGRRTMPAHQDLRAERHATVEIDHVLIEQADTARRDGLAYRPRFVGPVDTGRACRVRPRTGKAPGRQADCRDPAPCHSVGPCAAGGARPTSVMVGTGCSAAIGVVFRNGEPLQARAARR